jgi:hypothetical protein
MAPQIGIDHSKRVIADLQAIAITGVKIAKHGIGFGALKQVLDLIGQAKDLIVEAQAALPEIKDLDSQEVGQLSSACYELVRGVIDAVVTA